MALDYEFLECPGDVNVRIPLVRRPTKEEDEATGTRIPDWMLSIEDGSGLTESTYAGFEKYTEILGWYGESSRHIKGDTAGIFYSSATLWHSDVFVVTQNGSHIAFVKNSIASGHISPEVKIVRLTKVNNVVQIVQMLTFNTCHWLAIHAHLDWSVLRFTACKRTNAMTAFDQAGNQVGQTTFGVDYALNTLE